MLNGCITNYITTGGVNMTLNEYFEKNPTSDEKKKFISAIVEDKDGNKMAVSSVNFEGGTCDCCHVFMHENITVLKVIDIKNMEVLWEMERQEWKKPETPFYPAKVEIFNAKPEKFK